MNSLVDVDGVLLTCHLLFNLIKLYSFNFNSTKAFLMCFCVDPTADANSLILYSCFNKGFKILSSIVTFMTFGSHIRYDVNILTFQHHKGASHNSSISATAKWFFNQDIDCSSFKA